MLMYCISLFIKGQKINRAVRTLHNVSVNHESSGTLVEDDERHRPSTYVMIGLRKKTNIGLILHTMRAASDTIHVGTKERSTMTQTLVNVSKEA